VSENTGCVPSIVLKAGPITVPLVKRLDRSKHKFVLSSVKVKFLTRKALFSLYGTGGLIQREKPATVCSVSR
jgi:hypothetical protein